MFTGAQFKMHGCLSTIREPIIKMGGTMPDNIAIFE
jgi:hypothetical protein